MEERVGQAAQRLELMSSPILFVDCDDTLIVWKHGLSLRGDRLWEVDWDVVAAIERWQRQGGEVVVWSEKGAEYASTWARKAVPHLALSAAAKDLRRPVARDIAIDDTSLAIRGVCYRPSQTMLVAP